MARIENQIYALAAQLGEMCKQKNVLIVTAESCTGGGLSHAITAIPGSSTWFDRGFVTYSNLSKQEMLGVSIETLDQFGAVSTETVSEMAAGALSRSHAQISVSITGIAGPDGGTDDKPVGTVWFGLANNHQTTSELKLFSGDRISIRDQAIIFALEYLIEIVSEQ